MLSRLAVLVVLTGLVVCLDAFHIGVGKIGIRRKRPRRTLLVSVNILSVFMFQSCISQKAQGLLLCPVERKQKR